MGEYTFRQYALIRHLENGVMAGELLHLPGVLRLADSPAKLKRTLSHAGRRFFESADADALGTMHGDAPETIRFHVTVPKPKLPLWTGELELAFDAIVRPATGHERASVPALALDVIAPDRPTLLQRLKAEATAALGRKRITSDLLSLIDLQRVSDLEVLPLKFSADVPSPKERALREEGRKAETSVLKQAAIDLCAAELAPAFAREALVAQLAALLAEQAPQSVLLVGPSGVGKTALLHELVRTRQQQGFARTPFWETSGSRIVAGMSGYGMWQQRCDDIRREAARTRAILHLGNLVELSEVGRSNMNQQGVAGFLKPFIARGELLCVAECTPEQLPILERRDPHLLQVFRVLEVPEPDAAQAKRILESAAAGKAQPGALDTLERVHRRYAGYSVFPGRPLRFLRNVLSDAGTLTDALVYEYFSRETGLPRFMLDAAQPLETATVRDFFESRVIGQRDALALVTDLMATVKAALSRPRRPLASLLFVGPTGVGKTETGKALAEFLFGSAMRITRFDMSEYASPSAVRRLIGGDGAAGIEEGLLTARVREQPFAVLLFDEFEKAHPLFFDLLLQVLGEARLTDASGRLADFTNCVILMTSNLGAEGFQRESLGFGQNARDARDHFTRALENFVRPELINRIDRVVPFLPLQPDELLAITRRELAQLQRRAGLRDSGTKLTISEDALRELARGGNRPGLGARPLKREIEQRLLVPLADAINSAPGGYALSAEAALEDGRIRVLAKPLLDAAGQPVPVGRVDAAAGGQAEALREVTVLRRRQQKADRAPQLLALRNEMFQVERSLQRLRKEAHKDTRKEAKERKQRDHRRYAAFEQRMATLSEVNTAFADALARTRETEDLLQLALLGEGTDAAADVAACNAAWHEALLKLWRMRQPRADLCTMVIQSHNHDLMFELAQAYFRAGRARDAAARMYWISKATGGFSKERTSELRARATSDPEANSALALLPQWVKGDKRPVFPVSNAAGGVDSFMDEHSGEPGCLAVQLEQPDIGLFAMGEAGLHSFVQDAGLEPVPVNVQVFATSALLHEYADVGGTLTLRREYQLHLRQAFDDVLAESLVWSGRDLAGLVARAMERGFARMLEAQVGL